MRSTCTRICDFCLQLLVALKALANVGVASESFKEELRMMTEDVQLDVAIRVAAVEAHRRLPCEETRQYFENFFRNENEDSEVRIAAYLQVMRCPNYLVIRTIKHSLEYEEVNQGKCDMMKILPHFNSKPTL